MGVFEDLMQRLAQIQPTMVPPAYRPYPAGTDPLTADNSYFTQPDARDARGNPPAGYRDPQASVSLTPARAGMIDGELTPTERAMMNLVNRPDAPPLPTPSALQPVVPVAPGGDPSRALMDFARRPAPAPVPSATPPIPIAAPAAPAAIPTASEAPADQPIPASEVRLPRSRAAAIRAEADAAIPEPAAPPVVPISTREAPAAAPAPPIQIAPPVAPAPAAASTPYEMPSILDRIRTTLGDNSNTLLALGAGFAGAPNIGQGISRAAAAAIPARAADIKQTLDRTSRGYGTKALIEAGVPVQQAIAASGDPELRKALIQQYITDRKGQIIDIGFDRYGQPIKGIFDPYTKKITPVSSGLSDNGMSTPGSPARVVPAGGADVPGSGTSTDISAARAGAPNPSVGSGVAVTAENDITGPDYLQRLKETDPMYARQVEQVLNGDAAMPTGRQAQTPQGRKLRQDVLTVEPGASDADFATRTMVRKSYAGGNDSKITKSINTTLKHGQSLEKAINDLDNFSTMPMLNYPRSLIEGQTSEKYRKAAGAYQTALANFAGELDFAVSGGRPTVSGRAHQMEGFDINAAKDKQMSKLHTAIDFLKGRLDSHATGYAKGMKKAVEPIDFIDPANRGFYQRLMGDQSEPTGISVPGVATSAARTSAPAAAAAPDAPPPPGKYIYDREAGRLVPAQ